MHRFAYMALLLLLSGLTWPTLASPAQDTRPVIRVGFYDFPPYSYEDRQGRAQGSLLALTQRLLEQAGYRAELRMLPVARLYAGLQNGSVHVWPGAPGKPELQGYTLESRHHLGHIGLHLYFRADTAPPALPHGLTGRGLILISGYSYWAPYSQWLTDPSLQLQLHRTSSHAAALAMLQRQRGDFILDYQDGHFQLSLNSYNVPEVRVNRRYMDMIREMVGADGLVREKDKEAIQFVKNKIDSKSLSKFA